jgi:hypothetical protein
MFYMACGDRADEGIMFGGAFPRARTDRQPALASLPCGDGAARVGCEALAQRVRRAWRVLCA